MTSEQLIAALRADLEKAKAWSAAHRVVTILIGVGLFLVVLKVI